MHFITLSRKLGSNGGEIARRVAEELGYRLIDSEAIEEEAKELGLLESVTEIDEKLPSLFQRIFTQRPNINLARLNSVINDLAQKGDAVFLGRGGHMLLKAFDCGLHVRVVASRKSRIETLAKRGHSEDMAKRLVDHSDTERGGFIKFAFNVDWEDPELYDVVINTDKLGIDTAVKTITSLAQSSEINACSLIAMESLDKLALADRAEAAIIEAGLSYGLGVAAVASVEKSGVVKLVGLVEDEKSKTRAEEVVKRVKGVKAVENQLRVRPSDRHA